MNQGDELASTEKGHATHLRASTDLQGGKPVGTILAGLYNRNAHEHSTWETNSEGGVHAKEELCVGVSQVAKSNQEGKWNVETGGVTTKNYEKA